MTIRKFKVTNLQIVFGNSEVKSNGNQLIYVYDNNKYLVFDDENDLLNSPTCPYCHGLTFPDRKGNCNNCGAFVK